MDNLPRVTSGWSRYLPKILDTPIISFDHMSLGDTLDYCWLQQRLRAPVEGFGMMHLLVNQFARQTSFDLQGEPIQLKGGTIVNRFCTIDCLIGRKVSALFYRRHFPYPTTLRAEVKN